MKTLIESFKEFDKIRIEALKNKRRPNREAELIAKRVLRMMWGMYRTKYEVQSSFAGTVDVDLPCGKGEAFSVSCVSAKEIYIWPSYVGHGEDDEPRIIYGIDSPELKQQLQKLIRQCIRHRKLYEGTNWCPWCDWDHYDWPEGRIPQS